MKRAVFLDRDGVINEIVMRQGLPGSPRRIEEFKVIDGVKEALNEFKAMGFMNIVITNQPDVARGQMDLSELQGMHDHIKKKLPVDGIIACPHDDNARCLCRKPKPGMLLRASEILGIDLNASYFIGDTWRDAEAGRLAGCRTIIVSAPYNMDVVPDFRITDIQDAIGVVRQTERIAT
ncbi:MAG: HAD-IIIA family hydrolase [Deltaproteobacteria bacterium]